jgi:lysophospholipase L1-like esterase
MDTQPVPAPDREAAMEGMDAAVADAAREAGVPLLPRHALMSYWLRSGRFAPATLLGPDGLHMTDASYRCLAERVADLLPAAAGDPP